MNLKRLFSKRKQREGVGKKAISLVLAVWMILLSAMAPVTPSAAIANQGRLFYEHQEETLDEQLEGDDETITDEETPHEDVEYRSDHPAEYPSQMDTGDDETSTASSLLARVARHEVWDLSDLNEMFSRHVSEDDNIVLRLAGPSVTTFIADELIHTVELTLAGSVYFDGNLLEEKVYHVDGGFPIGFEIPAGNEIKIDVTIGDEHRVLHLFEADDIRYTFTESSYTTRVTETFLASEEQMIIDITTASLPPIVNDELPLLFVSVTGQSPHTNVAITLSDDRHVVANADTGVIELAEAIGGTVAFKIDGNPEISINGERVDELATLSMYENTVVEIHYETLRSQRMLRLFEPHNNTLAGSVTLSVANSSAPIAGGLDTTITFNATLNGALAGGRIESVTHHHGGTFNNVFICANHRGAAPNAGTYSATATFSHHANGRDFYTVWVNAGDMPPGVNGPLWPAPALPGIQNVMGVISFSEPVREGQVNVQKVSQGANTYINNNPLYSLEGAQYWVVNNFNTANLLRNEVIARHPYHNASTTGLPTTNRVGILTTNASGVSNTLTLPEGSYWAVEVRPSRGHFVSGEIYPITVRAGETAQFTSRQPVPYDPTWMRFQKMDADTGSITPQGDASFAGLQVTVRWFPGHLTAHQARTATPIRTWVYESNAQGIIDFGDESFLINTLSDVLWRDNWGDIHWPLGTITVEETGAPPGYVRDSFVHVGHIYQIPENPSAGRFRWVDVGSAVRPITDEGMLEMVLENEVIRGGDNTLADN